MAVNGNMSLVPAQTVSDHEDSSSEEDYEKDSSDEAHQISARRLTRLIFRHPLCNLQVHDLSSLHFQDLWDSRSPCSSCIATSHVLCDIVSRNNMDITEEIFPENIHNKGHLIYGSVFSPLHAASLINNVELVKLLVESGADVNAQTDKSFTPMHVLLKNNEVDVKIVDYLISHGADLLLKDCHGQTPLHIASEKSHVSSVTSILKPCYINDIDSDNFTPLMKAASAGSFHIVNMLIAHGADPNIIADNGLAFHYGVGNVDIFKYLIEKTDSELIYNERCFDKLLRDITIKNDTDCLAILVKTNINKKFSLGGQILGKYINICWIGYLSLQQPYLPFENWKRILTVLLENGLSINGNSIDCMPPLSVVTFMAPTECNQKKYVAELICCGANINYPDAAAPEALKFSCECEKSIMLMLLRKSDFATPDSVLNAYATDSSIFRIAPEVILLFFELGMTPSTVRLLSTYPVERVPDFNTLAETVCTLKKLSRAAVRHMYYSKWNYTTIDNIMKNLKLPNHICKYLKYLK